MSETMKKLIVLLAVSILPGCGDVASSDVDVKGTQQQVQNDAEQECKDLPDIEAGEILTICEGVVTSVEVLQTDTEEMEETADEGE